VKKSVLEAKAPAMTDLSEIHCDWKDCQNFWSESKEVKLDAINSLLAQVTSHLEDGKRERKRVCRQN
jgi:hypothetical protein